MWIIGIILLVWVVQNLETIEEDGLKSVIETMWNGSEGGDNPNGY